MRQFHHPLLHACGMARSAQTCLSDRVGTGTKIRNHRNTLDKQRNSLNHVEAAELQTTGVGVHVRRDHSNHPNHQSLATFSFPSPLIYHCLPPAPVHDYDLGLACSIIKKWQTSLVPNRRTGHILESGWQHRLVRNRYQIQLSRIWSLLVYSLRCLVCLLNYIAWCLDYRPGPAFCFWSIIFTAKVTSLKTEISPSKCLLAPDVYTELRPKAKFLQSASSTPGVETTGPIHGPASKVPPRK